MGRGRGVFPTYQQTIVWLFYEGPMPSTVMVANSKTYDELMIRGAFNYSLKTFCTDCMYWDSEEMVWKNEGLKVGFSMLSCCQ